MNGNGNHERSSCLFSEVEKCGLPGEYAEYVFNSQQFVLLTGRSNPVLAKEVGQKLHDFTNPMYPFGNGEAVPRLPTDILRSVEGKNVYILQSAQRAGQGPNNPQTEQYMFEVAQMIDAVKRRGAEKVNVIFLPFPYSRQEREDRLGTSIAVKVALDMLAPADRLITVDLHSDTAKQFFKGPWYNLSGSYVLSPEMQKIGGRDRVIASTDEGGEENVEDHARSLNASGFVVLKKARNPLTGKSGIVGVKRQDVSIEGKDVWVVDDMVDGGGSLDNVVNAFLDDLVLRDGTRLFNGERAGSVSAAITYGLFSGEALNIINRSRLKRLLITNAVMQEINGNEKIKVVSIAPLIAKAILCLESCGHRFDAAYMRSSEPSKILV